MNEKSKVMADLVVEAMENRKAKKIDVIEIEAKTTVSDAFIICSGTSSTQNRAIADEIIEKMKDAGHECAHLEGYDTASWILLDFIDVVAHIFREEDRQYYNLERLWKGSR